MRFSSLFVASLAVACGLSPAISQTGATTALPNIVVEAPKQVVRPQKSEMRTIARSAVPRRKSVASRTPSAAPDSVSAKFARLASATGSCADGCQSSFKSGKEPWHGCNLSNGSWLQFCRNVGNYKTYAECWDAGLTLGWSFNETGAYCRVLAINGSFGKYY